MVARDIGGRISCLTKGVSDSIGEMGWMEGWMIGRVLVMNEREEMDVDNIAMIMKGIEGVGIKSGESEQESGNGCGRKGRTKGERQWSVAFYNHLEWTLHF